jgi:beta-mannosidase
VDAITTQWLGKDIRKMSVEEYTYWGGLVQGEGLREYCDNFRRRMFDTSSAIFWMYNDCWPATRSWTIVDYYLRRTPCFMPVKRAMAPISVVVTQEDDGNIGVYGINETGQAIKATLRYGIFNLSGGYPLDRQQAVSLAPNASTRLAGFKMSEWKDVRSSAGFALLQGPQGLISRNRLFLPFYKDLKWPAAKVRVKMEKGTAVFESKTFAWGICLDLEGEEKIPDNFFDVYPGIPYRLPWTGKKPPRILHIGNLR